MLGGWMGGAGCAVVWGGVGGVQLRACVCVLGACCLEVGVQVD